MERGVVVGDRFEIEEAAGAGGMGVVYRAHDRTTGEPVAVKIGGSRQRSEYEREAQLLREAVHPGIVRYIDHGTVGAQPYIAMEWLEGEGLEQRLERGALSVEEALAVLTHAAAAIGVAHARGIVHHDVKPSNVWLVDGDLARVKILDFGLAESGERTGGIRGTPAYMAPEQVRAAPIDPRTDVYSLGCVLFECLAGRPPFLGGHAVAVLVKTLLEDAPSIRDLLPTVPGAVEALLARALAKDPSQRPADGTTFARELAEVSTRRSVVPAPAPSAGRITEGEQRVASIVLFGGTRAEDATVDSTGWGGAVDAARRVVESFGARLEVMIGGSVAVLLEGGGDASDQARRAASCALALREATGSTAMALATGRARVATKGRMPLGEVVDRAVALLGESGGGIRIDEVTAGLLGDGFDTNGGVLAGRREGDRPLTLLGRPIATVGREEEIGRLESIFAECAGGGGARVVIVTGPAGIGKSRVRREFLQRLRVHSTSATVWIARGDPVGAGSAFGLAGQIVRRAARVLEGEPLDVRQAKLSARVAEVIPEVDRSRVTHFLAELIGAPFTDEGDVVLSSARRDAMVMFDQIRVAWEKWVAAAAAQHPVVIVLDDLQWGDRPTVTLVDSALSVLGDLPVMVVAFARPDVSDVFPDLLHEHAPTRMDLGPLPRAAATELVVAALGERATPKVVAEIVDRAAGNAFFLEEIVRAAAENRSKTPETALLMVQSRLEAIAPPARRVLRAASVFGRSFHESAVNALLGEENAAGEWLPMLESLELVDRRTESKFAGERELVFHHALLQEAAYAMFTDADRTLGHELAATWLERAGETDAGTLAGHWERAGKLDRAISMWQRAAEQSIEGNDYTEAIARVGRGIACGATGEALGMLRIVSAEATKWLGNNQASVVAATGAMALLPEGSDAWAEAAADLAMALHRLLRLPELDAVAERLRVCLAKPTDALVNAAARVAHYLLIVGQRETAERLLVGIEAGAAQTSARPATLGRIEQVRASRALRDGRPAEYVERLVKAAALAEESGDLRQACSARANSAYGLLELGVFDEAELLLRRVEQDARRLGLRHVAANAKQNLGLALMRLGRLDEAATCQRACAAAFATQGDRRMEGASRTYLASTLLARGDLERAEEVARHGLSLVEDAPPARPPALAVLARIVLRSGRVDDALALSMRAMADLEAHGAEEGEALVRLVHAEALAASGNRAEAERAISAACKHLTDVASRIHREDWKTTYFENIEEHAATLALARSWGLSP